MAFCNSSCSAAKRRSQKVTGETGRPVRLVGSAIRLVGSADAKCTVCVRVGGDGSRVEELGDDSRGVGTL